MHCNWYQGRRYRRFWTHYNVAMNWCRQHRILYLKARDRATRYENWALRQYINYHPQNSRGRPETEIVHNTNSIGNYSRYESDDSEMVMEITDDMLEFLEISDRHREELRVERESIIATANEESDSKDYETPRLKPGTQRTEEMKALYGGSGAIIQAMETAMQLSFNHNCNINQPKYWPNIPLKL